MYIYHIISAIKFVLGLVIMIIVYTSINIYEDPIIGIGFGFLGLFIAARGISFYLFLGIQRLYRHIEQIRLIKDSYKLSLLFGIYVMINVALILLEYRNKIIGIVLLAGFILLQIALFSDNKQTNEEIE